MKRAAAAVLAVFVLGLTLAVLGWMLLPHGPSEAPVSTSTGAGRHDDFGAGGVSRGDAALDLPIPSAGGVALVDPSGLPPSEAPVGRGVLRILARWATSGEPAPEVALEVTAWNEPDREARTRSVRTGADGIVGFHGVAAGLVTVDVPRGGEASIEVPADEAVELEVAVSDDLLVRGLVLDAAGHPAPRASLWVSIHPSTEARYPRNWEPDSDELPPRLEPVEGPVDTEHGRIAARTDAAGRFVIKGLAPGQGIAALDERAAPSPLAVLEETETFTLDVTLTLGPPGAAVEGRVVDVAGSPVADAQVVVRPPDPGMSPVVRVLSDADGRFAVSGLPAGALTVEASASSGTVREVVVGVPAGGTGQVTIVLPVAASLAGTVIDAAGRPAAGTTVRMRQGGRSRSETAGEGGGFVFEDVAPGPAELTAWHAELGVARAALTIGESGVHRWDPVLVEGPALRGRLLYDDGMPAAGLLVAVASDLDGLGWRGSAVLVSDAEGRFMLRNCREERYRLTIGDARPLAMNLLTGGVGAAPGGDEIVVTVPRPADGEAHVHGCIATESPSLLSDATLLLRQSATRERVATVDTDSGAFRAGPVRAGDYLLVLEHGSGTLWPLAHVAMQAGRDLDLGTLSVGTPGELVVHTEWAPGTTRGTVRGRLLIPAGADAVPSGSLALATLREREDGTLHASALPPGEHVLRIEGKTIVPSCRVVSIASGGTTVETVRVGAGLRVPIRVTVPKERLAATSVRVRVDLLDAEGLPLASWTDFAYARDDDLGLARLDDHVVQLQPGSCRARVSLDDVIVLEQTVPIVGSDGQARAVTVAVP
ncbi:MAG: carboxypeptidase regulatory-like domain-containing protein [Planctomycetota bacterium]